MGTAKRGRRAEEAEEEEEERQALMGERVVVVEYLQGPMSRDLLCKFPDNSAFDFDYTQSSIWSPLAPRHFSPILSPALAVMPMELGMSSASTQRRLSYEEEGLLRNSPNLINRVTTKIKKKISTSVFNNLHHLTNHCTRRRRKKKKSFDFSPTPIKGWAKVLRAASKHFKKKIKRKDSVAHIKLSTG